MVLTIALILFGPRELPRIARTIGKFTAHLRSVSDDFQRQVMRIEDEAATSIGVGQAGGESPDREPGALVTGNLPYPAEPASIEQDEPEVDGSAGRPDGNGDDDRAAPLPTVEVKPVVTPPVSTVQNKDTSHEAAG